MWNFEADKRLRDKRLADLEVRVNAMAGQIEALRAAVEAQRTVNESAISLIHGLHEKLAAALADDDLSEVEAIVEDMKANVEALAAAVGANTSAPVVEAPAEAVEAPVVDPEAPVA